ncbi:MAG: hypothetical protein SRB1_00793 [Desulfobacteraceae bacterium Eth-SRB1]|nr:MAG: hypothetical protein SRB1_00793 [Desulfobacteraceae bacterium Eth-SRB1]
MKFFSPLNNEKFRKFIFAFFLLSSLLPILIVIFIAINYVFPILHPEQAENLWQVFIYALLVMFLFPSLSFLLLFQRMISLESLTEEIKAKSVDMVEGGEDLKEENEIETIRHIVNGLHNELQEKMNKLNEYSRKLIDSNIELSEYSVTDSLTALYNRRHFESRLREEISRAKRYGHNLSLIMFDIDDFKQCNDILGHQAGDELLKKIGSITKNNIRGTDIPFRYGGDEFAVLLAECDIKGAEAVANKLVEAVSNYPFFADNEKIPFRKTTISCGVASYSKGMKDFIGEADKLLYEAKNAGKGLVKSSSEK